MTNYTTTGGAKVGFANASYPFATLTVDDKSLSLNINVIGHFVFRTDDIISIEIISNEVKNKKGIQIKHKVKQYHKKIFFWTIDNPQEVLDAITATGFLDNTQLDDETDTAIKKQQEKAGSAFKKSILFLLTVFIIGLLAWDSYRYFNEQIDFPLSNGSKTVLSILCLGALFTLLIKPIRNIVLKEDRSIYEVQSKLIFISIISFILLIGLQFFL